MPSAGLYIVIYNGNQTVCKSAYTTIAGQKNIFKFGDEGIGSKFRVITNDVTNDLVSVDDNLT